MPYCVLWSTSKKREMVACAFSNACADARHHRDDIHSVPLSNLAAEFFKDVNAKVILISDHLFTYRVTIVMQKKKYHKVLYEN